MQITPLNPYRTEEKAERFGQAAEPRRCFPACLALAPVSRRPTILPEATVRTVLEAPIPETLDRPVASAARLASIIIVTRNNLVYNRLTLQSLLHNTDYPHYEVLVIDNGSEDGTRDYLR